MDQRQYPRFSFEEPIAYQKADAIFENGSLSSDLSLGGARIRVSEFISLHSILGLKLHLNNPSCVVDVKALVVWVRQVPHSDMFDVGLSFVPDEYHSPAIGQFLFNRKMNQN